MFVVKQPWRALLAQMPGEGFLLVGTRGKIQAGRKQSSDDIVNFNVERFRVDDELQVHDGLRSKKALHAGTVCSAKPGRSGQTRFARG